MTMTITSLARRGLAAALALALSSAAFAHAKPEKSDPPANAAVAAPQAVSIDFTETLEPAFSSIVVVDAAGAPAQAAKAVVDASACRSRSSRCKPACIRSSGWRLPPTATARRAAIRSP